VNTGAPSILRLAPLPESRRLTSLGVVRNGGPGAGFGTALIGIKRMRRA
jgi:hypothetical protein